MSDARDARLARAQHDGRLPTVAACTFDRARETWRGAVGGPADGQYRIGSITKTLTAVLVLQCRDEGLLDLADPIGRFVPETGYAAATVADLLAHLSGMQSEPVGPWWERSPGGSFDALVAANDGSGRVAGPGEWFHYSNLGFALLGEAVARLRGEPWWSLVSARLLAPLGMDSTSYAPGAGALPGRSVRHFTGQLDPEPHTDTGAMAPAGQAWSTLDDLVTWGRFLIAGHPDVLAAATVTEMAVPRCPGYALGLQVVPTPTRALVGHTGTMPGFQAGLYVDRAAGTGVALLTNATTGITVPRLAVDLLDEVPAEPPAGPWVPTGELPADVAALVGLWFWGNSAYELRLSNGGLDLHDLVRGVRAERFERGGDGWVGVAGYHRGERLHVAERRLTCATFVYTQAPYEG